MPTVPSPQKPHNSTRQKQDATAPKPKTADKQTPMKPANFGKAIGIDKPANVRDKIRKWQADLEGDNSGAENAVPAAPSPKLQPTPKAGPLEEKPSPKPAATPKKPVEALLEKPKSAKKPTHNPLDEDVVIATAPKKRVVSDSHWRTQKSPTKEAKATTKEAKSPTKDATTRPAPKPAPTAWVRPAARKAGNPETKVSTPNKPELKPAAVLGLKSTGQKARTRNPRRRRLSQPAGAENENRPNSSGSGSSKAEKEGDEGPTPPKSPQSAGGKYELVRVRRRRRSGPSPRSSLSADEATPVKGGPRRKSETLERGDVANQITVEYEESRVEPVKNDFKRSRRRSQRRSRGHTSPEGSPREPLSSSRHRPHRSLNQLDVEPDEQPPTREKFTPQTPPNPSTNRLQAWLQTTPDPFVDADVRKRRTSKESVSTLELPSKPGKSDISARSASNGVPVEDAQYNKSESRRKSRPRGESIQPQTNDPGDEPSTIVSSDITEDSSAKGSDLTPTQTLKRRGARRSQYSPTKDRLRSPPPSQPATYVDDASSLLSSVPSSAPSSSVNVPTPGPEVALPPPRLETLATRRIFPTTGKRLSTIASVETFATKLQNAAPSVAVGSEAVGALNEPDKRAEGVTVSEAGSLHNAETLTTLSRRSTRRNKLASHADLISVLSMPRAGSKSIVSARSIRTNRSRLATATIDDIMNELASDEDKYMRELRTLVDGVIPVLLSCVLSKSDSAVAAGLFSRSSNIDPSDVTKPIVDMGVSLERLKSLHRRVPKTNPDAMLSWARSAQRIYSDYINVWRLGFEDVVVSLAPADEDPFTPAKVVHGPADAAPWDEGLPRNAEGYVVNGDGERVDVAYMLKRPLVRLKYLAKTFRGINHVKPSEQAENTSAAFQDLVTAARKRAHDERARLEDEAAANIDPTRARDPKSLAPLAGVRIDPSRCVRARDYFDMHLMHSTGQEISCQVELLLRDNSPGTNPGGDVLICEVDATGRWLLLPPIQQSLISARSGDEEGEIVVMIRGYQSDGKEWAEVFSLRVHDGQAGSEWVQMLGLLPVPPQVLETGQNRSILSKSVKLTSSDASSSFVSVETGSTPLQKSRSPSPREIEIPIGEQANETSKKWGYETPDRVKKSYDASEITPPSTIISATQAPSDIDTSLTPSVAESGPAYDDVRHSSRRHTRYDEEDDQRTPRSLNEAMKMAGRGSPVTLRRTKAKRRSKVLSPPAASPTRASRQIVVSDPEDEPEPPRKLSKRRPRQPQSTASSALSQPSKGFSVWMPSSDVDFSDESDSDDDDVHEEKEDSGKPQRPQTHRRVSSVPSMEFPSIPRIRQTSQPTTPTKDPVKVMDDGDDDTLSAPASAPSKLENSINKSQTDSHDDGKPPPVPPHRTPSPATPVTLKASSTPVLTPSLPGFKNKRRSSSPLKHEYEPSTATESSTESEEEISDTDELSATSDSSDGELDDDVPMPLMPVGQPVQYPKVSPPASIYTLPNGTITPSQSASNTPYRTVPQGSGEASKAIASIFSWSDAGRWDSLHPEECSIVVTPGKIQVFEISSAHSKPFLADGDEIIQPEGGDPLVAVELTPLVPMRKSTAIDITIRSPPTTESRLRTGNNIMLRSRNPAECAQLYAMINQARINNPTYIALQNARGPYGQSSWAEAMDRQNAARSNAGSSSGWFSGTLGRKSSYRKTSTRAASISAVTESSVGTMNSALRSALGRFTFSKNGRFNIRGSTLGSRSITSFDTGSSGSGTNTPVNMEPGRASSAPAGITTIKCRLYERDSFSSKWRDMGSARLSIMLPEAAMAYPTVRQGKGSPGMRNPTQEKRIVVAGKSKGETMLDVTLGESSFERVARTGIAVSVWEDVVGPNGQIGTVGAVGGVSGARATVYMIQMKTERECAYAFSLLGRLRY